MMRNWKLHKGFSLVEILVYMGLMSIFLLVLLSIFTDTLNTKLASESTSALDQDSRYILSRLTYDINNADSIVAPATGSSGTTLSIVKDGVSMTYSSSSGNFVLTSAGTTMNLNSLDTSLDNLNFQNVGAPGAKSMMQVSYTLRSKIIVSGETATQSISTTIGTR